MNPWDTSPYSVTPAAQVLSRCIASGALSQEDLDTVRRETNVFSQHLLETEKVVAMRRETDEKSLEVELLKLEKGSADVTHSFYLSQKFAALQDFTSHLQEVLREQASLRQRLMKPLCQQNLAIEANLHRYVVELIQMSVELIENLESKVKTTRSIPTADQSVTRLNNALAQLLTQVAEVDELSRQVLQWKSNQHNIIVNNNDVST